MADPVQEVPVQEATVQEVPTREVYVGPRPFERSDRELFFGRDREISELLSLVISSRVVLCYAPSGAGKTSLINAGLLPRLEGEGFEVLPSSRVKGLVPEGIDQRQVPNLYIFNALLSLAGKGGAPEELASRSLAEYLSTRPHRTDEEGFPAPRILIFDQFEELLTSYPERWQEREGFFRQVHDALEADPLLRVLFSLREDFLARVEPFIRLLKPYQQARFRLALLGPQGAGAAITGPLRRTGRRFKEGVAAALVEELLKERVETAQGEAVEVVGEYVEPVQLQVVCRNLWTSLPPDVQEISSEHLKAYGNVDQALQEFYEDCLAEAKTKVGANELTLRQWFEGQLITPAGTRGIVFRDAMRTADLPNTAVDFLEDRHLIRGEWRAGSRWYELTHDRLIEPIQQANARWRARRQARRNRWIVTAAVSLILVLAMVPVLFNAQRPTPPQAVNATAVNATAEVIAQSTAQVQVVQANEKTADATSRQLAAQALLVDDPDLSLLLAVEANKQADTQEARRSLHTILSRKAITILSRKDIIDGKFLREFNPEILSPRLVKRLEGHKNWVHSVAFSPDGRRFVSGSVDTTLILWDVATTKQVGSALSGQEGEIWSVAFSPTGDLIASAGLNGRILLWDASTVQPFGAPLVGHTGLVTCVSFSPDGSRLASGGEDGKIRIWSVATGESLAVLPAMEPIWSVAWSPDGKTLASGGSDSMIRLWETERFSEIQELKGHRGFVRSVAWSPDGRSLASGSLIDQGRQSWGEVILWDAFTGQEITRPLGEDIQPVRTVAFDPSGTILAIGRDDGTITLWDTRSERILGEPLKAHSKQVMSVAFSPDGQFMVSGSLDQTVALWDLFPRTSSLAFSPTGELLAASDGAVISLWDLLAGSTTPVSVLSGHTADVLALEFYNEGVLASAGLDESIQLWDVGNGQRFGPPLTGHSDNIYTLAFSPDGKNLVSAGEDGAVLLWDLADPQRRGKPLMNYPGAVLKALFGPGGKNLYLVGRDGGLVTLDLASGETQNEALPAVQAGQTISSLAFRRDGREAAYFHETGTASLADDRRAHGIDLSHWDQSFDPAKNPGDIDFIVVKATDGVRVDSMFEQFVKLVQDIPIRGARHLFRPDQPWQEQADLFLSAVQDKGFQFYTLDLEIPSEDKSKTFVADAGQWLRYVDERVEQKVLLQVSPSFYQTWLGPSADWVKNWPLLIMYYPLEPDRDGKPILPAGVADWKIWNYSDGPGRGAEYGVGGRDVFLYVYNGTPLEMWEWLEMAAFSIYDRDSGQLIRPGQSIQVNDLNGIAFSSDGSFVASGGERVSLMSAATGVEFTSLSFSGRQITSLRFSPDGGTLAVGTEDGTVLLWDLGLLNKDTPLEPALELACSLGNRNFTDAEWKQYFGDTPYQKTCPNLP